MTILIFVHAFLLYLNLILHLLSLFSYLQLHHIIAKPTAFPNPHFFRQRFLLLPYPSSERPSDFLELDINLAEFMGPGPNKRLALTAFLLSSFILLTPLPCRRHSRAQLTSVVSSKYS